MPIVWVDEIAGLEPAINFLQGRGYTSKLWPYAGVEEQFLAYLPLQGWLHIAAQKILWFSVYAVRLPYAIFLITGTLFIYSALHKQGTTLIISLAIIMLLLNEKSLFETTRGIRVEPISFLLLSITYWSFNERKFHVSALSISFALLLHPYLWPASLILFLGICKEQSNSKNFIKSFISPNNYWLYPIGAAFLFLVFIHFDVSLFLQQFGAQAERHATSGSILERLTNHLYYRFWPYYSTQVYIPLFIYATFLWSTFRMAKRNATVFDYALIFTHLAWLLAIGPMHRYNSVLVILSLFAITPLLKQVQLSQLKKRHLLAGILVLGISCLDVSTRQALATVQRAERNPTDFLAWFDQHTPDGKCIVSGHEATYYAAAHNDSLDFFLFNTLPYRYSFDQYDHLLIISETEIENANILGIYTIENTSEWTEQLGSKTYNKLHMIEVEGIKHYTEILEKMRIKNSASVERNYKRD